MPTITKLHVENFGCVKNVDVALTPLHAFIGPNDSGKSTLLKAIVWSEEASRPAPTAQPFTIWRPRFPVEVGTVVARTFDNGREITIEQSSMGTQGGSDDPLVRTSPHLRLDPDELRRPCPLILPAERLTFLNERGYGLASVFDSLTARNLDGLIAIRDQARRLFPTLREIGFPNHDHQSKVIQATLVDGTVVPAQGMSEGLLYFLALASLPYLDIRGSALVEEPENGLHPARIAEVVRVLRDVSKTTQVVLATHSPLVINELAPDEVSVVTRDPVTGTKVTPIADTPNFEERSKVYQLGELWLAYSDGERERPLLEGGPRP